MLGRIHAIGAVTPFVHRPALDSQSFGYASVALIRERFIPPEYLESYTVLTSQLLTAIDKILADAGSISTIRAHGDCHAGNILWRDGAPHFVDFDDARMAPAVQDLWMMLSGERPRQTAQLAGLIEGYNEFCDFNPRELQLIGALRALRMLHYSAWLARRWEDPIFPRTFPWFNTVRYWGEQILELREQLATLSEPPLELP
jgi:Ser/Thr protein kinase RdoA (MazF antagonist)